MVTTLDSTTRAAVTRRINPSAKIFFSHTNQIRQQQTAILTDYGYKFSTAICTKGMMKHNVGIFACDML